MSEQHPCCLETLIACKCFTNVIKKKDQQNAFKKKKDNKKSIEVLEATTEIQLSGNLPLALNQSHSRKLELPSVSQLQATAFPEADGGRQEKDLD